MTRVFSGPPVAFHISSIVSIIDEQLLGGADVHRLLDLGRLLGRLPAGVVEVRELLDVLRLEVVVPQDVDVVLRQLGALLLDGDAAGAEELVVAGVVLLDDP